MLQDSILPEQKHEKFIEKVCNTQIVWTLNSNEGYANTYSNEFEDEEGNELELMCFWSEEALAKAAAVDEWSNYKPEKITLSEFLESWCLGMADEDVIVGTEFDTNMFGYETDPLDLILEIGKVLKQQSKNLKFKDYENLDELMSEVENMYDDEE